MHTHARRQRERFGNRQAGRHAHPSGLASHRIACRAGRPPNPNLVKLSRKRPTNPFPSSRSHVVVIRGHRACAHCPPTCHSRFANRDQPLARDRSRAHAHAHARGPGSGGVRRAPRWPPFPQPLDPLPLLSLYSNLYPDIYDDRLPLHLPAACDPFYCFCKHLAL